MNNLFSHTLFLKLSSRDFSFQVNQKITLENRRSTVMGIDNCLKMLKKKRTTTRRTRTRRTTMRRTITRMRKMEIRTREIRIRMRLGRKI